MHLKASLFDHHHSLHHLGLCPVFLLLPNLGKFFSYPKYQVVFSENVSKSGYFTHKLRKRMCWGEANLFYIFLKYVYFSYLIVRYSCFNIVTWFWAIFHKIKKQFTQKCFNCHLLPLAIQDVVELVFSLEQIWRNVALHYLLNNGSFSVNGCCQIIHNNPHDSCPSVNDLWSEKLHACKKQILH